LRDLQRSEVSRFNQNGVYLPNPSRDAPIDRHRPQAYDQKVKGLGLAPNVPKHFWQLLKGDAGSGSSSYRTTELFQLLAPTGGRTAATPYSKAVEIMALKSSDQRARYFHASLFSVGRVFAVGAAVPPFSLDEVTRFAAGIPAGTPSVSGSTQFGVPQFSTTTFRIMVFDESGQRFVDVDVEGTRSMSLYGFGVTVFALIKDGGYTVDRQSNNNPLLGPGLVDQSVVGARIIPIRSNETKNINNRTVTIRVPGIPAGSASVPIPPGARTVQVFALTPTPPAVLMSFATIDPLDTGNPTIGSQGLLVFKSAVSGSSDVYRVPNSNAILITPLNAFTSFITFVFEVTP
jgi:hypothetical protein